MKKNTVQQNVLHRQRMTCADSLRVSVTQTQDWTGGMRMSPSGRFQVIEEARPKQRLISRKGVRWDLAWILIAAIALLCVVLLLVDVAHIGLSSRSIRKLDSRISDYLDRNDQMKQELALSTQDISICTEAVKLNLVSGNAVRTICLATPPELSSSAVTTDILASTAGR